MKKWILKAVVQKGISFLPFRHNINYFFQKYITKGVFLSDEYFQDRLQHAKEHIDACQKYISSVNDKVTLELGTGWYPVVPISMFLAGAAKIHTLDISPLCDKEKLCATLEMFLHYQAKGEINKFFPPLPHRFDLLKDVQNNAGQLTFEQMLAKLNIVYTVGDARNLPLEDNTINLVHSNNTFEHVYPEVLTGLLTEFKRVVKPEGIMSHFVDMSDHFAHFDKSISIYNFLKFSDKKWALIDNDVQPQNRWRLTDYKSLYENLNLNLLEITTRKGNPELLKSIRIHEKFNKISPDQLAISHCLLISNVVET
ncbi:MAG: class I SAM-dependent methyltransferase [Saprospiraceae bacterium]|nr:class I SAM-dependent methyltransferase [Saprospiraceae bacterium]MCB9325275.1 class I SAM-dependent methyltransferase [Lewinellaceae bacterium]